MRDRPRGAPPATTRSGRSTSRSPRARAAPHRARVDRLRLRRHEGGALRRDGRAAAPLGVRAHEARRGAVRARAGSASTSSCGRATCTAPGTTTPAAPSSGSAGARAPAASATGSGRPRTSGISRSGSCRCCSPAGSAPITWPGPSPPAGSTSCTRVREIGGLPGAVDAQAFASLGLVAPRPANSALDERVPRPHRASSPCPAAGRQPSRNGSAPRPAATDGAG